MAEILNGKELASKIKCEVKAEVEKLKNAGRSVSLAVVLVGEDPASCVYVKSKIKDCEETGILSKSINLPETTTEQELLLIINELNADQNIDGILVQLPLPKHINEQNIIKAISPDKDVDGFHVINAGKLMTGERGFVPCTPLGAIKLIEQTGEKIEGKHAVIIGRSNIVGKPMAMLLLAYNATVTVCHSKTQNLKEIVKSADIIVAAVGKPKLVTKDMVKEGAIVIDVGVNRVDGKLCGDVDFEEVSKVAGFITPMPGGTGPMTRAMLMANTLESAKNK